MSIVMFIAYPGASRLTGVVVGGVGHDKEVSKEAQRHDVERLLAAGAQIVDVLPESEFQDSHLPGAINIPLPRLAAVAERLLDPARPTVVYCKDTLCDLSPRAARRLDALGFREVYDYVASKVDWLAAGLPFEGTRAELPHLATLADRNTPTCEIHERADAVRDRVGDAPVCVVVDADRVVLGLVTRMDALAGAEIVSAVMEEGPRTFRPHASAVGTAKKLDDAKESWVVVTNLDGTLVGVADLADVRHAALSPAQSAS
jgi:rhodanese-related sulfurtransferase